MSDKIRVGVIFGGRSGEHDVSVNSARSVIENLDPARYEVVPIGITRKGEWHVGGAAFRALEIDVPPALQNHMSASDVGQGSLTLPEQASQELNVVIPVLHGPFGEDGTVQGLFEILNIPYVGSGILASAVGMDKAMMKAVFAQAGLPQCSYHVLLRSRWETDPETHLLEIEAILGYPCFVKPANLGSSVGISKALDRNQLREAIQFACQHDRKIIIEEGVNGREIEVGVLGNEYPRASVPGEIVPKADFYDYNAKYISGDSDLIIPADIPAQTAETIRQMAIQAYQAIDAAGLSRVDFFLERETGRLLINEINTFPGFTIYSMYPKLWEATDVSYSELIDELIQLAIERHKDTNRHR